MLVHRYAVLKVQPKSHNQTGRFNAAQPRRGSPFYGRHQTRTALLGSRTENELRSELSSESPAQIPKDWVVSTNSLVELNDSTSAPTGNLRLTHETVMASWSEVTP